MLKGASGDGWDGRIGLKMTRKGAETFLAEVVVGRERRGLKIMLGRLQNDEGLQNNEHVQNNEGEKERGRRDADG